AGVPAGDNSDNLALLGEVHSLLGSRDLLLHRGLDHLFAVDQVSHQLNIGRVADHDLRLADRLFGPEGQMVVAPRTEAHDVNFPSGHAVLASAFRPSMRWVPVLPKTLRVAGRLVAGSSVRY